MTNPHIVVMSTEEIEYEDEVTRYLCTIHHRLIALLEETDEIPARDRSNYIIEALISDRNNTGPAKD